MVGPQGRRQSALRHRQGGWARRWGSARNAGDVAGLAVGMNDDGGAGGGLAQVDEIEEQNNKGCGDEAGQ